MRNKTAHRRKRRNQKQAMRPARHRRARTATGTDSFGLTLEERRILQYLNAQRFTAEANATNCRRNCRRPKPKWIHLVPKTSNKSETPKRRRAVKAAQTTETIGYVPSGDALNLIYK